MWFSKSSLPLGLITNITLPKSAGLKEGRIRQLPASACNLQKQVSGWRNQATEGKSVKVLENLCIATHEKQKNGKQFNTLRLNSNAVKRTPLLRNSAGKNILQKKVVMGKNPDMLLQSKQSIRPLRRELVLPHYDKNPQIIHPSALYTSDRRSVRRLRAAADPLLQFGGSGRPHGPPTPHPGTGTRLLRPNGAFLSSFSSSSSLPPQAPQSRPCLPQAAVTWRPARGPASSWRRRPGGKEGGRRAGSACARSPWTPTTARPCSASPPMAGP